MTNEPVSPTSPRVSWRAVLAFLLLACAWSWPLFWLRDMRPELWNALPLPPPLRMTLLMWGPGLAALLCWRLFRAQVARRARLAGGAPWRALAFYAVPMLALSAIGAQMQGPQGMQPVHGLILLVAVVGFVNCLGEELGWRGFLQDALRPLARAPRYLLIGLFWAAWHFTNLFASRTDPKDLLLYLAWYLPSTVALSALLGESVERSRALVVATTFHAWVNLSWELGGTGKWIVLGLSLPYWAWLLWTWPRAAPDASNRSPRHRGETRH